ncbi:hypothetical protein DPMN_025389 [Dreissena polymorpha]|uniref:Uncharacterized protein n=1 Tax=Dreissena polymorpha TaxID=45954 RepID=A0A9D4LRF6_DREPO|nr:hypothetical protein DPMN_025389 [Dreissena polymorpha]
MTYLYPVYAGVICLTWPGTVIPISSEWRCAMPDMAWYSTYLYPLNGGVLCLTWPGTVNTYIQ